MQPPHYSLIPHYAGRMAGQLTTSVPKPESQPYAILSHTWEEEEVSFQEMANLKQAQRKKGFAKIERTCELARNRFPPLPYVWIDTCCIDKTSSVELAEAINSMFAWYKQATVCFVFLSDFPAHRPESPDPALPHCRWFTRGWTLQELIAPKLVEFYDCEWDFHGTKSERINEIASITGVVATVLEDSSSLHTVSVAKRMSWAAARHTTREEDMAYCLLGIFDVNMAMIYGEGEKAFMRLQKEIIEDSNDMTLFAWTNHDSRQKYRGIFARSASEFKDCGSLEGFPSALNLSKDFTLTNHGLRMQTRLPVSSTDTPTRAQILALGRLVNGGDQPLIGIYLTKTPDGFVRCLPDKLHYADDGKVWAVEPSTAYIRKDVSLEESRCLEIELDRRISVTFDLPSSLELDSLDVQPSELWDQCNQAIMPDKEGLCMVRFLAGLKHKYTKTRVHFVIYYLLEDVHNGRFDRLETGKNRFGARVYSEKEKEYALLKERLSANDNAYDVASQLTALGPKTIESFSSFEDSRLVAYIGHGRNVALQVCPRELKVGFPRSSKVWQQLLGGSIHG